MDCIKIGELIRTLRKEQALTQSQLADRLNVSDKAISKWERGLGCPDISLIADLSSILGVDIGLLLKGDLPESEQNGGSMRNSKFYVCPACGNITITTGGCEHFLLWQDHGSPSAEEGG
jgi:DNA-binding XRE family transcriptional regulator